MNLLHVLSAYLLVGAVFGLLDYVLTWRAFRREGRQGELPKNLLGLSVRHQALVWPETVLWGFLLLASCVFFERKHK